MKEYRKYFYIENKSKGELFDKNFQLSYIISVLLKFVKLLFKSITQICIKQFKSFNNKNITVIFIKILLKSKLFLLLNLID